MIKKRHIILCFLVFCLTATLLVGVTSSAPYDPWCDPNDDGIIDIVDIVNLAIRFGEEGTPINKTALLLGLQDKIDSLNGTLEARIPKKGIISVSGVALRPNTETTNYTNYGRLYNDNTDSYASFYASVQLPHGVTVTNVTFYWYDAGADYIICSLLRQDLTSNQIMASANSPAAGAPGISLSYDDTINYATVDNSQYAYLLYVNLPWTHSYFFTMANLEYEYPA